MSANVSLFCPKCNNSCSFYRYGKDSFGNQKYQCRLCNYQFAPVKAPKLLPPGKRGRKLSKNHKYPSCPKCGKASFLHHDYPTHSNFRCGDKRCFHSFFAPKSVNLPPSVNSAFGKNDLKRMRHAASIIFTVLSLYFFGKDSFRQISLLLFRLFNVRLSHVTVAQWCVKFAPIFNSLSLSFLPLMDFNSDEWHADETVVKVQGKKYYLWFVIDSETRFILGFYLSDRSASSANAIMSKVKSLGSPRSIVTDNWDAYNVAVSTHFPKASHICVENFDDDISNNVIESFNKTFKAWYNTKCGFDSYLNAHSLISVFLFFYNYLRPHSSLSNLTPAQVAGLIYNPKPRNHFIRSSYHVGKMMREQGV